MNVELLSPNTKFPFKLKGNSMAIRSIDTYEIQIHVTICGSSGILILECETEQGIRDKKELDNELGQWTVSTNICFQKSIVVVGVIEILSKTSSKYMI